jgi:TPR repeat protein
MNERYELIIAAETGDAQAQFDLAQNYFEGTSPQSRVEAAKWLRAAADSGLVVAQRNLAYRLCYGENMAVNKREAIKWYRSAAKLGDADSHLAIAEIYDFGDGVFQNEKEAFKWYLSAAKKGNAEACAMVSSLYASGIGRDEAEALKWLHSAAELGHEKSRLELAEAYFYGSEVPYDADEALKWFRLAAEQGSEEAQEYLDVMTDNGEEVLPGVAEAAGLSPNPEDSRTQLALALAYLNGDGVPQDDKRAFKWFRLAAMQGVPEAQCRLGAMYKKSFIYYSSKQAFKWFSLAAEQGIPEAQMSLGDFYEYGYGGPKKNYHEALRLFRAAAEQGLPEAQHKLAVIYDDHKRVPQNDEEAVKWLRAAAESGHPDAQNRLGKRYDSGSGVPQTIKKPLNGFVRPRKKVILTLKRNWATIIIRAAEFRRTMKKRSSGIAQPLKKTTSPPAKNSP